METRQLAFVYTPEVERLSYPADCPFKTQRAGLARARLASLGLLGVAERKVIAPSQATLQQLSRIHSHAYLKELQRAAAGDLTPEGLNLGLGTPDTPVFKDLFEYGAWACGAGLTAADLLLKGEADIAFNLLGGFHHAHPERAGGFCYLNDVALACDHLARAGRRVVCLDVDAHHGDGTQAIFYNRDDVFTISMHESGKTLFPWGGFEHEVGLGLGLGYNANLSLPAETYDEAFLHAFDAVVLPVVKAAAPEVLVLELGLDILAGDPLTHLRMTNNVVVELLQRLLDLRLPLLITGGGGYHVENTVRGWALAWQTCCSEEDPAELSVGLGGVLLGSSEWTGGLRDRVLPVMEEQRQAVEPELARSMIQLLNQISPLHTPGFGEQKKCRTGTQG